MKLVIDYREKKLIGLINSIKTMNNKFKSIEVVVENLPLSDIIIKDNQNNEKILIERKTINDLASSIQDGRYNEQSYRLNNCEVHNHNIMYLIEGNISMWNNRFTRINKDTIYSAIFSIMYYKGFSVFVTSSTVETAEFLLNTALKIEKNDKSNQRKNPYYENITSSFVYSGKNDNKEQPNNKKDNSSKLNITLNAEVVESIKNNTVENTPSLKYSKYVKREKKSNITPENIDVIMLSQIPNISVDIAMQIIHKYKTIYNLIKILTDNEKELNNFMIKTKSGERKLNSRSIGNIKNYLIVKQIT